MNSYEFTKTYSSYFFLYKPNEENRKYAITSKTKNYIKKIHIQVWSVIYSNKENSPRPNNADFLYFADKTIIKTCTKFHFVMNLFPVSTHM